MLALGVRIAELLRELAHFGHERIELGSARIQEFLFLSELPFHGMQLGGQAIIQSFQRSFFGLQ